MLIAGMIWGWWWTFGVVVVVGVLWLVLGRANKS
jgi:hypothetical protein